MRSTSHKLKRQGRVWAIKKVFTQRNVTCDEHGPAGVISKSSFRVEETEKRILRGYCRGIGPGGSLST